MNGGIITLSGTLPPLKPGMNIISSCAAPITINANRLVNTAQTVGGGSRVEGLNFINVNGVGVRASGKGNLFRCVKVQQTG